MTAVAAAEQTVAGAAAAKCAAAALNQAKQRIFSLENSHFLEAVCAALKRHDKRGSGLMTAARFNDVLRELGVAFGSPEADLIMRYCKVTDEGYVVYKELMMFGSRAPRRHLEDHVKESLCPASIAEQDRLSSTFFANLPCKSDFSGFTPEITDAVRRLYAQWERCCLRDWQFKAALEMLNVKLTPTFEQLLALRGPSGSVSFSQLMKALMIDDPTSLLRHRQDKALIPVVPAADRAPYYEPRRNPLTWTDPGQEQRQQEFLLRRILKPSTEDVSSVQQQTVVNGVHASEPLQRKLTSLQSLVSLYSSGKLTSNHFRQALVAAGVPITSDIDLVIREQEADNSGHYTALLLAVLRAAEQNEHSC